LKGKDRREQEAFRKFHSYYNFTARFCNTDSGHEKGGVEGLVGFARRNYMVPIPRAQSLEELNEEILLSCLKYGSGRPSKMDQEFLLHDLCRCGICGSKMRSDYGTRRVDGTRSRHYVCYWHRASPKLREIKGRQKCSLPLIPAELLEWEVFYVELMRQLGIEPEHYEPLLDGKQKWDSKIEGLEKTLGNVKASLRRKEMALRNLDSLLEHEGFEQAAYFQKRNGFLLEVKSLDQKLKVTQKDLEELRQRKSEEAEFSKLMSGTDPFKALTYKIINLPFVDKYRLLRGLVDGPIVVGHSTSNPQVQLDSEDGMMKILDGVEMTIRHNHTLLLELLPE